MLSARIAALRRAARLQVLDHQLRVHSLFAISVRRQSTTPVSDHDGETRAPVGQPPEASQQASLGDPFAADTNPATQVESLQQQQGLKYQVSADVFQQLATDRGSNDPFAPITDAASKAANAERELMDQVSATVFEPIRSARHINQAGEDGPSAQFKGGRKGMSEAEGALPELQDGSPRDLRRVTPRDFSDMQHVFSPLQLSTDPAQLKALPTGFHDMTEREQQEELWLVQQEEHMGRDWELPDPGKHTPYSNDYPAYSPSKVIGMLHRWRNRAWTPQKFRLARAIASNRSLRLPVLTAQAFLRRHTLLARRRDVDLLMERYLGSTEEWKLRLAQLESETGVTEADIKRWLWILSPQDGDVQIQRFLKSKCRKPLFLLQILLAKDKKIHEPATFLGLLQFMRENYVLADRPQDELAHPAYKNQGRAMTWWHFIVFLYRLVWHCREGWPAAMPLLARLTADYIGTIRLDSNARAMTGYQARSLVLNKALQYLSWPARIRPFDHMEHNWAAQRHLLRLAATAEPPLVMDQNGYRAVRTVLIALAKTKPEAKNADRAARTWPPYRRTVDGMDERRDPEDDLSRSVKAGMLVRAAGYSDDIVDRALSALGGSTFGHAPTIQTRSLRPRFFSGRLSNRNMYVEWASQVKATRNAREAWMVFGHPPEPGVRPDIQVYGEMFEKLYARPVTESPVIRPGDVKEAFPVHNGNLSEYEIARLTPPTPEELYDRMLMQDKIRPTGYCLVVLIRNSSSKIAALRYLRDSPYAPHVEAFRRPVSSLDRDTMKSLAEVPWPIFNAWIAMLCQLHKRVPGEAHVITDPIGGPDEARPAAALGPGGVAEQEPWTRGVSRGGSIPEAISLAAAFQAHNPKAASRDRHPWTTIMQALAGRKVLYSRLGAEYNVFETLVTFLDVYERTTSAKGIDPVPFEALCLMIRKALKLATFSKTFDEGEPVARERISGSGVLEKLLVRAHRHAVEAFARLSAPIFADDQAAEQQRQDETEEHDAAILRFNVVGRPVYRYMLALACCGDGAGMVRLMDWLLDGWDQPYVREEARATHSLDYHYTVRTIAYFAEMGRALVDPAETARVRDRLENMRIARGCTWFWPREDWAAQAQALPELATDLVLVERWKRLRQLVTADTSAGSGQVPAASLDNSETELPVQLVEQGEATEEIMASGIASAAGANM